MAAMAWYPNTTTRNCKTAPRVVHFRDGTFYDPDLYKTVCRKPPDLSKVPVPVIDCPFNRLAVDEVFVVHVLCYDITLGGCQWVFARGVNAPWGSVAHETRTREIDFRLLKLSNELSFSCTSRNIARLAFAYRFNTNRHMVDMVGVAPTEIFLAREAHDLSLIPIVDILCLKNTL